MEYGLSQSNRLTLRTAAVLVAIALSGTASVRAGMIHAQAGVEGFFYEDGWGSENYGEGGYVNDYWRQGMTGAQASDSVIVFGSGGAWGQASVSLIHNPGFRFFTEVVTGQSSYSGQGQATALAQWVDVIRLSGQETLPDQIRVNLHFDAVVTLSIPDVFRHEATANFGVKNFGRFGHPAWHESAPGNSLVFDAGVTVGLQRWGEDSEGNAVRADWLYDYGLAENFQVTPVSLDSSRMSFDTAFDLWYYPSLGGYSLSLVAGAQSTGHIRGYSRIDALNTLRLTNVTLTNGDPISADISFDSGFSLTANVTPVPEPSSIALLATGGLGLSYGARRRRQQRSVRA